jgi:thymidylate kinase
MLDKMVRQMRKRLRGRFVVAEGPTSSGKSLQSRRLAKELPLRGIPAILRCEPTTSSPFGRAIRQRIEDQPVMRDFIERELVPAAAALARELRQSTGGPLGGISRAEREARVQAYCEILSGAVDKLRDGVDLDERERQYLFIADRYRDIRDVIEPALQSGTWVVLDRYDVSTLVYGSMHGLTMDEIYSVHVAVLGEHYLVPDATLYFAVSPEEALERLVHSGKPRDRYEASLAKISAAAAAYPEAIQFLSGRSVEAANAGYGTRLRRFSTVDADHDIEEVARDVMRVLKKCGLGTGSRHRAHRKKN